MKKREIKRKIKTIENDILYSIGNRELFKYLMSELREYKNLLKELI